MSSELQIELKDVMEQAGGYSPACFPFIRDGLAHTVEMVHGNPADQTMLELGLAEDSRHVCGRELCIGLRDFAIDRYGMLAKSVLNKWGIHCTRDFGNIIFAMVDVGLMRTTDEDCIEDFDAVFEFDDVFCDPSNTIEPACSAT